jgi:hypothetical protein
MKKDPFGVFEVVVPAKDGQPAIAHNSKIKAGSPSAPPAMNSGLTI